MPSNKTEMCPESLTRGQYTPSDQRANAWVRRPGPLATLLTTLLGLSILSAMSGCMPKRLVVDLSAGLPKLKEATVLQDPGAGDAAKIALIRIDGMIADASEPGIFGDGPNPVSELFERLRKAEQDPNVRGVILRINSPGGTVTGSDIMYGEVRRFMERSGKPVIASMGEIAASGGYYLALACDEIIAHPTTITASIGVLIQTINFSEGLSMIGVQARAVTSGANKDMANPLEPMQNSQYALLQELVDEYYVRFRSHVIDRRPEFSASENEWALDGRIMSGAEAEALGLVDRTGDIRDAFDDIKSSLGLTRAKLVMYHRFAQPPETPYAPIAQTDRPGVASDGAIAAVRAALLQPGAYYIWRP